MNRFADSVTELATQMMRAQDAKSGEGRMSDADRAKLSNAEKLNRARLHDQSKMPANPHDVAHAARRSQRAK
jgi:hypothetical protein